MGATISYMKKFFLKTVGYVSRLQAQTAHSGKENKNFQDFAAIWQFFF